MLAKILYKTNATNPDYFFLCESGVLRAVQDSTTSDFGVGEFVEADGEQKEGVLYLSSIEPSGEEDSKCSRKADAWKGALLEVREPKLLLDLPLLEAMGPVFKEAALVIQSAIVEMQPILVRYDEDTDGITSALYIHSLVEHFVRSKKLPYPASFFQAFQSEAPIFEHKHLQHLNDIAAGHSSRTLVVLLDHGGNEESLPALEMAKKEGLQLMLVDHHPPFRKSLDQFDFVVHSHEHGGSSSACTGFLAYHIASSVYDAPKEWAHYAMQADKSSYALKEFFKEAVVIDFAARDSLPLAKYASIINDKKKVDMLYAQCMRLREKSLGDAIAHRKTAKYAKLSVQWLDLSYVDYDYPPKGGIVQGLHESQENSGALITVGYDSERMVFRANEGAEKEGFAANELIADLKKIPNLIASGGGHRRAASIRLKPKKLRTALDELERRFKESFG